MWNDERSGPKAIPARAFESGGGSHLYVSGREMENTKFLFQQTNVVSSFVMTITNETFEAFLRCPTKCFLQAEGAPTSRNLYAEWVREEAEAYRLEGAKHLSTRLSPVASINGL